MHHPAAHIQPADFEPDETFYGMIAARDTLYVVGPNHGQGLEVKQNGHIRQLIDISATQGHIVPTAIAANGGTFHVGNLNTFPIMPGTSQILDISRKFGFYVLGKPMACICQGSAMYSLLLGAYRSWRHQNAIVRGKAIAGGLEVFLMGIGVLMVSPIGSQRCPCHGLYVLQICVMFFVLLIAVDISKED